MSKLVMIHLDFETYSPVDLVREGVYKYFEHEDTDVWCVAYYIEGSDVTTWLPGDPVPEDLLSAVRKRVPFYAHNAMFEFLCWNSVMRNKYGWPELKLDQMVDTMAMCQSMAVPGGLNNAIQFLERQPFNRKHLAGEYKIMQRLMKPGTTGAKPIPTEDELASLAHYCEGDVKLEHHIGSTLSPLCPISITPKEQLIWRLHQRMNMRGVRIDEDLVATALKHASIEADRLNARMSEITNGEVGRTTQVARIKKHLADRHNLHLKSLAKDTIDEFIDSVPGGISDSAKEVIDLRMAAAKSSVSKFKRMLELKGKDGRIKGMFRYCGASQTGRTSSTGVQLQNLVRDSVKPEDVPSAIASLDDGTTMETFGLTPYPLLSRLIRSALIPEDDHLFVVMDYSAVEARGLAWLTNNDAVIDAFIESDANEDAPDLYEVTYAGMFGVAPESVTKDQRFIGKVACLALGYGGGENAFAKMARNYGVDIPQHEAMAIKNKWRIANPMVQKWWYSLEATIRKVIRQKINTPTIVDEDLPPVTYRFDGKHLWCGLPSGRELCYPFARMLAAHPASPYDDSIIYAKAAHTPAANQARNWPTQNLYGGLAAENITQAICRDLLMDAMLEIDQEVDGRLIMTIHDEVVIECRASIANDVMAHTKNLMSVVPDWAEGLPLTAEGGVVSRYTKV